MSEEIEALVLSQGRDDVDEELYLINEFKSLLKEAGFSSKHMFIQNLKEIDPKTYFGKGKMDEVRDFIKDFNQSCGDLNKITYIACNFDFMYSLNCSSVKPGNRAIINEISIS